MSELFGSWVAGGNSTEGRKKNDFYGTPKECTYALLAHMKVPHDVWEPACGEGAISNILSEFDHHVISTDLNDYGFGASGVDFLKAETAHADCVITNPPFNLAEKFIRKCHELELQSYAMLLKTQYWHAAKRVRLFHETKPAKILAMTWRPDFTLGGSPTMDCIWTIWERGSTTTQYLPIERVR